MAYHPNLVQRMCKRRCLFAVLTVGVLLTSAHAQTQAPLRVLFIGNSYTFYNGMPALVEAMGQSAQSPRRLQVKAVTQGGATLEKMWEMRATRYAVSDSTWDVVVLQEQSTRPIHAPDRMHQAVAEIDAAVRKTGARTMLYMTWSRRGFAESQTAISEAYRTTAQTLSVDVAPVGLAWHKALAQDPALALYAPDGSHPSAAGSYLAACVLYLALLHQATSCPVMEVKGAAPETLERLRSAALMVR